MYLNLQPRRTCSYFTTYSASPYPCMSSAYKSVPPLENTEHTPIYIYVLRLKALKGKTDFIRFIRKWQLFGDFYTILSFPAFDIFGTCSNRYHFNTFRGKFGFRSRVKLSLGIFKNLKISEHSLIAITPAKGQDELKHCSANPKFLRSAKPFRLLTNVMDLDTIAHFDKL